MKDEGLRQIQEALGLAIRNCRVRLPLSQEAFAELVGLHRTYIGSVERGERNISLSNIAKISSSLGLKSSQLLALAEEIQSSVNP